MKKIIFFIPVLLMLFFAGCFEGEEGEITFFAFEAENNACINSTSEGVISETDITVYIQAQADLSALVATFVADDAMVKVNGVPQESGVTANDFSAAVEYEVTPQCGETTVFTVTTVPASTFEDLTLAADSYWNGDDDGSGWGDYFTFVSGDACFTNYECILYDSWEGFAYSNMTDTTTVGWTNQYSVYTGEAHAGSSNFAIGYTMTYWGQRAQVYFGYTSGNYEQAVKGFFVTNTTYAALNMLNGDEDFAKKFGGEDGTDTDWFLLTVYALDENYEKDETNTVEFYMADYRFENSEEDYIVDEWTWLDLTSLGEVYGLEFELTSSDVGEYGMNTPAYFAMDNLVLAGAE
ncbi:MAG: DUF4465 domain-containing protein [Spirochaetes bacterium]|nr:DUF4465 domain-containing protein [Spirochaetota bacterium]